MSRKHSVFSDELGIKHENGGIYSFMAFEYFDKNNKAVFKIGQTTRELRRRTDNYHTYFPMGVSPVAVLENPTKGLTAKDRKDVEKRKQHYEKIEKYIMKYIIDERDGYQIVSTTRIKDSGKTEWVYTDQKSLEEAFKNAQQEFGGTLHEGFDFKHEDYVALRKDKQAGKHYVGKIIYPLVDPNWITPKAKGKKKK